MCVCASVCAHNSNLHFEPVPPGTCLRGSRHETSWLSQLHTPVASTQKLDGGFKTKIRKLPKTPQWLPTAAQTPECCTAHSARPNILSCSSSGSDFPADLFLFRASPQPGPQSIPPSHLLLSYMVSTWLLSLHCSMSPLTVCLAACVELRLACTSC